MTDSLKKQHQRPEGALIEAAMKAAPKTSGRKLAEMIGLSEGRIRQIVNGYRSEGGQVIQIVGPADTVARMAEAVGVTREEMRAAGRQDVADEMSPVRSIGVTEDGGLWLVDTDEQLTKMREWLDEVQFVEKSPGSPPMELLSLWDFEELMEAALAKHRDELRLKDYFIELFGRHQTSALTGPDYYGRGGDGNADDNAGGPAPTNADDALAAHDEEHSIEDEQEADEFP